MNPNGNRFSRHISKTGIAITVGAVVLAGAALYYIHIRHPSAPAYDGGTPSAQTSPTAPAAPAVPTSGAPTPKSSSPYPATANLPIPFTPQAPTGNWDQLHEEACEEASSIMANAYLTGDTDALMPPAQVEAQISGLTAWEQQNFGYYLDTTAAETAKMIEGYYHLNATVVSDYTETDIEKYIAAKDVVIIPVDGQLIGNPNYTAPGPIYHMLVVRGYTGNGATIITNDSGTKNGKDYPYSFNTLHSSGADWNHSTNTINRGTTEIIVVSK